MPDDKLKNFIQDTQKGVEYFGKIWRGRNPQMERMEKSVEGPETPSAPPPILKPESEKKLQEKSTGGSSPFTFAEMKKGYRKL